MYEKLKSYLCNYKKSRLGVLAKDILEQFMVPRPNSEDF